MDPLQRIAYDIVLRACGFGCLGIFCVMIGLSFMPRVAFQAGGILTMVMTGILVMKAKAARSKDHRHTEMWLYLPKEQRPATGFAQQAVSAAMRETYLTFARWTAAIAIVMWAGALVFSAAGW